MAAIDKTYVNKQQLLKAVEWCKQIGMVTLENGYTFYPLDKIYDYNGCVFDNLPDDKKYVLWSSPVWFDRWLWNNCSLTFVREYLEDVYDKDELLMFEVWSYKKPKKDTDKKYEFVETPKVKRWKGRMRHTIYNNNWPRHKNKMIISVTVLYDKPNGKNGYNGRLNYDKYGDNWGDPFYDMLPYNSTYIWNEHHKGVPNKKSIVRMLKKWNLPRYSTVIVSPVHFKDMRFKIIVK